MRELEEESASVETVNPGLRTTLKGRRIEVGVLACEAVEIRVGGDCVVIRDDAVYRPVDNTLLVPEGEFSGQGVRQVSSYVDGSGDWCEADERADVAALADAIALLRSPNPAGAASTHRRSAARALSELAREAVHRGSGGHPA